MAMEPVEWVLVVYYGPEAHRATYGRQVRSNRYTKDYIQLSRKADFLETVKGLFAVDGGEPTFVPLTYHWPSGSTPGAFVFNSSDRPHLKWETSIGAPKAWKMSLNPGELTSETIPGDPSHLEFDAAEKELTLLDERGAGQPFLMAIKLRGQARALHLRVYLAAPSADYSWADIRLTPPEVQELAKRTSQKSALAWKYVNSGGEKLDREIEDALLQLNATNELGAYVNALQNPIGQALADYIEQPGYGLFFDPARNHDSWWVPPPLPDNVSKHSDQILEFLRARFPKFQIGDAAAETYEVSADEIEAYSKQIQHGNYEIPDHHATAKTRGSAQRAFSKVVKSNYGFKCAITNISTKSFLVASHIVPWSMDQSIRLDPENGICLSILVDKAFEEGFLIIEDDLTIRLNGDKVGSDSELRGQLEKYDGRKMSSPNSSPPNPGYLQRRRSIFSKDD